MSWNSLSQPLTSPDRAQINAFFEDVLRQGIALRVSVTGSSMQPLIESGAIVTLQPTPPERIGTGDLIFFRNRAGNLILHRVLQKALTPEGWLFQTKGDARQSSDTPIPATYILGKVRQLEHHRSGKTWNFDTPLWRTLNWSIGMGRRLNVPMHHVTRILRRLFSA